VAARAADDDGPVVICYDGSKHAAEAIDFTGSLIPGARALVVTVWTPVRVALTAVMLGPAPPVGDPVEVDTRQRRTAEALANDGSRRAMAAGLRAEALAVRSGGKVWEAIEKVARERDGRLVVCGARRSGAVSAVADSIPGALMHNAARPVLVVPSSQAVNQRLREPVGD